MERKHAIIIIKNEKNKYLQYYDNRWESYLFPNCKINDKLLRDERIQMVNSDIVRYVKECDSKNNS